jgi:micrococcal nuclease
MIAVSLISCTDAAIPEPGLYRVNTYGIEHASDIAITALLKVSVERVIDGDTIAVMIANPPEGLGDTERVRLLGVDTPETVHPNKEVQFWGKEAGDFTRVMLGHADVYLAFDWDLRDRYNRVLAYVYLTDGRCYNTLLLQEGYAYAYTYFPFQFMEEFRACERHARQEKQGLWAYE